MKTNFTKRWLGAWRQALMVFAMISVFGIADAISQTCTVASNTVLDPSSCTATVQAADVATGGAVNFYSVTLQQAASGVTTPIPPNYTPGDPSVIISTPGIYQYQVNDASGCWGTFIVDDKSGPVCEVDRPVVSTDTLGTRFIDCDVTDLTGVFDTLDIDDFRDCTGPVERVYWVDEFVTGCIGTNSDTLGTPLDGLPNLMGHNICAVYKRTWYAVDTQGKVSEDNCVQYVYALRSSVLPSVPTLVEMSCDDASTVIEKATYPWFPKAINTPDSIFLAPGIKTCKYIATVQEGEKLPTCGNGYKQVNVWTVIDWCTGTIVVPATPQLLLVEDKEDPTTSADGTIAFAANPFDCSGTITVGAATGTDNCSPGALTWTTTISATGSTGYNGGGDVSTVINANGGTLANVPIGSTVTVTWVAEDECGNKSAVRTATFTETVDNRAPVAICNDELNVTLVATNDGPRARVYAEDLDDTSRDNCGIVKMEVSLDGTNYSEYVLLTCDNLGEETVYLRVTDGAESPNSAVCWTTITVEDKSVPVVTPPAATTVTCLEELPAVGTPVIVSQGCIAPTVVYDGQTGGKLSCGEGEVVRTWTVTPPTTSDAHTAPSSYEITQTITITKAAADWDAIFPVDVLDLECDGPNSIPDELTLAEILTDNACEDWRMNVKETRYSGTEGEECFKLVRTYTLINWCTVGDPGKAPLVAPNDTIDETSIGVGSTLTLHEHGIFTYSQTFKVSDGTVPTADIALTPSCDDTATDCNGGAIAVAVTNAMDNCSDATITDIELSGNGVSASDPTPEDGMMNFTNLPGGTYMVTATVKDGCGNTRVISSTATVDGDCKKPTPVGVVTYTALMESDEVDVWLSDIETSSYDNCTSRENLTFGIELLEDTNNDGEFSAEDASGTMPTDQFVTLTCDKLNLSMLALWVMDEAGNTQLALIPIGVSDNDNSCVTPPVEQAAAIQGNIVNEHDEEIDDVMVKFSGTKLSPFEQLYNGVFNYSVPMHTDLTITPEKDLGYMNGISTADLVKLQRHILGISSLSSAYQMIAADVNNDEKVDTRDMLHVSRLILGLYEELPNSNSWRFVSKSHVFTNPTSPWGFPEAVNFADLEADQQADFIGIKIADLTGNARPTRLIGDDSDYKGEMAINIDDAVLTAGETGTVTFKASDFKGYAGYQFTVSLRDDVRLVDVTPGVLPNMSDANFGLNKVADGIITTSWSNANAISLNDGDALFSLSIEATSSIRLSEVINITSQRTAAEAYDNNLDIYSVRANFIKTDDLTFELFQNQPNPFDGNTMIGFNMPKPGVATLKVMNVAGQVLATKSAQYPRGYNQISLDKSELNASGVLYYQIETESNSATRKMVILE